MKHSLISLDKKNIGEVELDDSIYSVAVRKDIMARMVRYQLAKRRAGSHQVQFRSDVKLTGAKAFKQKGTGNARRSSNKVSQFRGGGRAFGPIVRDHSHSLPKKIRAYAFKSALSMKNKEGKLIFVDDLKLNDSKTKTLKNKLNHLGLNKALFISGEVIDDNFFLASKNLPYVNVLPFAGANVYDMLKTDHVVISKQALELIERRFK